MKENLNFKNMIGLDINKGLEIQIANFGLGLDKCIVSYTSEGNWKL